MRESDSDDVSNDSEKYSDIVSGITSKNGLDIESDSNESNHSNKSKEIIAKIKNEEDDTDTEVRCLFPFLLCFFQVSDVPIIYAVFCIRVI